MDLKLLQDKLKAFALARGWERFHTPKNLSMALMVEAAELMELFQWVTPEESRAAKTDKVLQTRVGEELADVLLYLLQLADQTGVDLEHAVADKLLKNAKKHPIGPAQTVTVQTVPAQTVPAQPEPRQAQTHVLVDWENVQPKEADIRRLVPDVTNVWIFHGPNQKRVGANQQSFGDALTLVPISRPGKNALDFHLSYYVGYISSRSPRARFVVISNDQGYGPMLDHAGELGFAASQIGFVAPAPARKTPTKKLASVNAVKTVTAVNAVNAASDRQAPAKTTQPKTSRKSPTRKSAPAAVPQAKTGARPTTLSSPSSPSTPSSAAPPKKSVPKPVQAKKASTRKPAAGVPQAVPASGSSNHWDEDIAAYQHVLASLRKSKNKPTRKARLYGAVKSLLGAQKADDVLVSRTVQRLVDEGHLTIDAAGAVTKTP